MRAEQGFTLLEVLVAFIIASLALAVLFRGGLDGLSAASLSARTQEAMARAQSHLAAIGPTPQPGDRQGEEGDGYHWHVRIVPIASAPPHATLLAVQVGISWGDDHKRTVELDSARVVPGVVEAP